MCWGGGCQGSNFSALPSAGSPSALWRQAKPFSPLELLQCHRSDMGGRAVRFLILTVLVYLAGQRCCQLSLGVSVCNRCLLVLSVALTIYQLLKCPLTKQVPIIEHPVVNSYLCSYSTIGRGSFY